MLFYLINLLIIFGYAFFFNLVLDKKIGKKLFLVTVFLHLVILMGSRSLSVGTDTYLYYTIFNKIGNNPFTFNFSQDSTFIISGLNKLIYIMTNGNYQVYLYVIAAITVFSILLFIVRIEKNITFSALYFYIAFYFYLSSFNISRQMLAVSIGINIIPLLMKNKVVRSLLVIMICLFIHNTAIILLALIPLSKIEWNKKKYLYLCIIILCTFFAVPYLINTFVSLFPHYSLYTTNLNSAIITVSSGKKIFVSIFYLFVFLCGVTTIKKDNLDDKDRMYSYLSSIMIVAIIIGIVFFNNILISRLESYFSIGIIVYLPLTMQRFSKMFKQHKLVELFFLYSSYIIALVLLIIQLNSNLSEVIPYVLF